MSRWFVILAAVWLVACRNPDLEDHPSLQRGEDLYRYYCAACHRDAGQGSFLKGVPPVVYASLDIEKFVAVIQGHRRSPKTLMPVFLFMPRAKAEAIASYLQGQLRDAPDRPRNPDSSRLDAR